MRVFWPLLLFFLPACTTLAPVSGSRDSVPLRHGPYLALGSDTGMTVVWSTAVPGAGAVLFGPTPQLGSVVADTSAGTLHQVALAGLVPGSRYYYRVVSGGDSTLESEFRTAPPVGTSFTCAAYGDTRTLREAHVEVLRRMAAYKPDFVINSGDLVSSNTEQNWDHFFTDLCESTAVGGSAPYYSTPGNHESGSMYYENMVLPRNNPDSSEAYYSFTWGDCFVVAVNSEIPFTQSTPQYQWLKSELVSPAARNAKFRIAFWHRPPYSTGRHGSDLEVRKVLCPLVESAGVDIVFNGHDHDYERTIPFNGTTYIVSGGGGAPLYGFMADSTWDAYKESMTHFCILRVSGDTLKVSTVRASDGAVRDSFQVVRPRRNGTSVYTEPQTVGAAQALAPDMQKASRDSVVQFLVTAAATDFHTHRPPDPVRFRDVRLGHLMRSGGEKQYMLCGQFLPAEGGDKAQWTPFVTIKTSGYEQWIGARAVGFCQDSSITWDKGTDLSSLLQSRLDSLR